MVVRKQGSKEVSVQRSSGAITPIDDTPDYLKGNERTGMEGMGRSDFKVPRILLTQALSPQIKSHNATNGHFWHTGINQSLGETFLFVPIAASKRVVLWKPRKEGGGILAMSRNAKEWDVGANHEFKVRWEGSDVVWKTKSNVEDSGLLEWGSANPREHGSPPAATLIYEYLAYLVDHPNWSPVVMGLYRTAVPRAQQFNTTLYMTGKPINSIAAQCSSEEDVRDAGEFYNYHFKLAGYVDKATHDVAVNMAKTYAEYDSDFSEDAEPGKVREFD